jgi:putative membrane-bound dehydrogenase-like protein
VSINKTGLWRWLILAASLIPLIGCGRSRPPFSPQEALKTFQVEPGLRIELLAAEPDVVSPVAMDIDEDGRIFVVEDRGYPQAADKRLGRVKLLEDTNGDGRPDRTTIFADHLSMPTGVMRCKKGIIVTDAPDVIYFEDTDGDGKANVRQVLLTGFPTSNPQHTVNGPVWGLDNWIYLAHKSMIAPRSFTDRFGEDTGTDIRFVDTSDVPPLKIRAHNIRFRPDSHKIEALSGYSQFGHAFDQWGHHFETDNTIHIRHEVIRAQYLERNPDLPVPSAMEDISDYGNPVDVFPIVVNPELASVSGFGKSTSTCGITIYLGGALGPAFEGSAFIAEPVHSLVLRDILTPSGATYLAGRSRPKADFLASTDSWFRPVNFYVGPDGALYMIDYYRPVLEHPEWIPEGSHQHKIKYEGMDRGRIYRIVPEGPGLRPSKNIHLSTASSRDLVNYLASPNIWWRRIAQRMLVARNAIDVASDLEQLFNESTSGVGRLHALWTLEGLGRLNIPLIEKALGDPQAGVRENAIILAEPHIGNAASLREKLLSMESESDPKVRFQLLCTLGTLHSREARAVRDHILQRDLEDKWVQTAALSSSSGDALRLFLSAIHASLNLLQKETKGAISFLRQVTSVIGARQRPAEIHQVLLTVSGDAQPSSTWWRLAIMEGLALGMQPKARTANLNVGREQLIGIFQESDPAIRRASLRLLEILGSPKGPSATLAIRKAMTVVADPVADADLRADSVSLLVLDGPQKHSELLRQLVTQDEPEPVRAAAVNAFGKLKDSDVGGFLLKYWRSYPPLALHEAADALVADTQRAKLLMAAIQKGEVQAWMLTASQKYALIDNPDASVRDVARSILRFDSGVRAAVLKQYAPALSIQADTTRGKQVFKRVCAKCHRLNGVGAEVGPDLGTVQNRGKGDLLADILMPNRSIAAGYESYVVQLRSGGILDGVIGNQSTNTVTLRHEEGKQDVIQRKDIKSMYVTNLSAMPEDLEKQVDANQMADLLGYLKNSK